MAKLKVPNDEAERWLKTVDHESFQEALGEHWKVDEEGNVKAQSVLWLYCWAVTGMSSVDFAKHVTRLFNGLLEISFDEFDSKIDHDWAQVKRYADGDIEPELAARLSK